MKKLLGSPQRAAMLRTTTAATMFDAGVKDNVLPISATAVVNFRILPGETVQSVTERVREVIDDDRVEIRDVSSSRDPSPVSDPTPPAHLLWTAPDARPPAWRIWSSLHTWSGEPRTPRTTPAARVTCSASFRLASGKETWTGFTAPTSGFPSRAWLGASHSSSG